ncbi:trimeric intracellular cation channel family protein [Lutimaribacter sp. EGI FJ00015]|uniref:Trimeric intracellular cation channel family protein n=1 Tax=Lutimaribacter degradans TaxID=2945989 RepID=A0ACC5ZWC4_9RHOB|nr:trimeric intracellular cation channel family protein [Lutimaribacter sp. EGI FJ00013]MCM2562607.1 trimeric intracellular cation channel family protein [Lutimaribacter sp. EGI FJ00013]MCO0613764.1 trimeric intracellular cation channel family protein [Lutimaribacter sp. EGI FJ00015]MCO0636753.1 trimeric intracellular cation channel family protein [Lutimaribacter sp. EGI FJ00014]
MNTALLALDYTSVLIFALTGALVASRTQLDIVGFAFLACLTAVGGGTLRDVLLDRNPVFWIASPGFIGVAVAAAITMFFTAHLFENRYRALLWLDACALSVAVSAGAGVALSLNQPAPIVIIMGMITGCMGGLMRDVVVGQVPLVLKQGELYVSAAFAGATAAVLATNADTPPWLPLTICATVTLILRAGSLRFGWRLPVYRSRPPRN